jgi:GNAT superfamily N-acetyltransferase
MIWSDAWTIAATDWRPNSTFNTTLPPPPIELPTGIRFDCLRFSALDAQQTEWIELVGTGWSAAELKEKLGSAWIPLLLGPTGEMLGTAIFWPRQGGEQNHWLLETLRIVQSQRGRGLGRLLMAAGRRWLWSYGCEGGGGNPFVLAYTWELSGPGLIAAWWRGWLRSAVTVQRGWVFAVAGCGFCPDPTGLPNPLRSPLPRWLSTDGGETWAIVNDSGGADGWGHVCMWSGAVDWISVAKKGGWRRLWARADAAPSSEWRWSGEFVVVSALNGRPTSLNWVSADL